MLACCYGWQSVPIQSSMARKQNGRGFRVERSQFRLEQEVSIGHFQKNNALPGYSIER